MTLTKKDLAALTGYTYRWLIEVDNHLPDDGKLFVIQEDGKYDLATFVQRWVRYNIDRETSDHADLEQIKAEHEQVKMQKTSIEVEKMRGNLIDVQDVKKLWGDVVNAAVQNLIHLPSKVAPQLLMMDNAEIIASIIDVEVRQVLTDIAATPLPDYAKPAEPEKDDDDE